jgi:riboflavin biosynthesis pyrimidine reductase
MKIINVMASSLDGRIGIHNREGDSERQDVGLSGSADQRHLRLLIEISDSIIVGASSIRSNGDCLDHPGREGTAPVWYVFAKDPLPPHFAFWKQSHIPRVIVSSKPLPIQAGSGVENLVFGDADPAIFLHAELTRRGHQSCLLFGGGIVNNWFYRARLIDELQLTLAPVLVGRSDAPFLLAPELMETVKLSLLTSQVAESFVFLKYSVLKKCHPTGQSAGTE